MRGLLRALKDIWVLASPFFVTRDVGEARVWPFPAFRVQERWIALILLVSVIGIELGQVGISVRLSYFSRDMFDAIQSKDGGAFWTQLLFVFSPLAAIWVTSAVVQLVLRSYLQIRWRRWMTEKTITDWLDGSAHYRMSLVGSASDNPDQRIAEDVNNFILITLSLSLSILSQVTTLVSFTIILWRLSEGFTFPGTDILVPGFLFWIALIYAVVVTWLTNLIGRPLISLNYQQQRYEADFRFSLARLREYGEQVALLRGEGAEHAHLSERFRALIANFVRIINQRKKLAGFTVGYKQINAVLPYIFVAPYYFLDKITLGVMQQTAGAFSNVQDALSFFIDYGTYTQIADYKAAIDRLTTFRASTARARALGEAIPHVAVVQGSSQNVEIDGLSVALPKQGRDVVRVRKAVLKAGESVLVNGPSGTGKSTLFRAISGIWPFGRGTISVPKGANVMLLPQRPYVPLGTLRDALTYPAASDAFTEEEARATLDAVHLHPFADRLDEEANWGQTLSLGEQQRLALGRALLAKPDWLFLDEATSALDEPLEEAMYKLVAEKLPGTTVVSIGHRHTLLAYHRRRIELTPSSDGIAEPREAPALAPAQ